MKITKIKYYGGAAGKICRLGLSNLFLELQEILLTTQISVLPKKNKNGAAVVRTKVDEKFDHYGNWEKKSSGDIDWKKQTQYDDQILVRIGIEIQVSGRSDLLARDLVHIRNNLREGEIDVAALVVPSKLFASFLTDRVADIDYAIKYVEEEFKEAKDYPIVLISIEHDGESQIPLPKKTTNRGTGKK